MTAEGAPKAARQALLLGIGTAATPRQADRAQAREELTLEETETIEGARNTLRISRAQRVFLM